MPRRKHALPLSPLLTIPWGFPLAERGVWLCRSHVQTLLQAAESCRAHRAGVDCLGPVPWGFSEFLHVPCAFRLCLCFTLLPPGRSPDALPGSAVGPPPPRSACPVWPCTVGSLPPPPSRHQPSPNLPLPLFSQYEQRLGYLALCSPSTWNRRAGRSRA